MSPPPTPHGHGARDAEDARLLARGSHAELLAAYYPLIRARLGLRLPEGEALEVAHRVVDRLIQELSADKGRSYRVPFRVVVLQVTKWTLAAYLSPPREEPLAEPPEEVAGDPYAEVEERNHLESLFADLPERVRQVLTLRWIDGLTPEQIARRLGIERNAVDQAIHRGYGALRERRNR